MGLFEHSVPDVVARELERFQHPHVYRWHIHYDAFAMGFVVTAEFQGGARETRRLGGGDLLQPRGRQIDLLMRCISELIGTVEWPDNSSCGHPTC